MCVPRLSHFPSVWALALPLTQLLWVWDKINLGPWFPDLQYHWPYPQFLRRYKSQLCKGSLTIHCQDWPTLRNCPKSCSSLPRTGKALVQKAFRRRKRMGTQDCWPPVYSPFCYRIRFEVLHKPLLYKAGWLCLKGRAPKDHFLSFFLALSHSLSNFY